MLHKEDRNNSFFIPEERFGYMQLTDYYDMGRAGKSPFIQLFWPL
jgi:hypothetical protein